MPVTRRPAAAAPTQASRAVRQRTRSSGPAAAATSGAARSSSVSAAVMRRPAAAPAVESAEQAGGREVEQVVTHSGILWPSGTTPGAILEGMYVVEASGGGSMLHVVTGGPVDEFDHQGQPQRPSGQ